MENKNKPKTFRILSIDGGGIRGIIPARFLCELESQVNAQKGEEVRLCDYFDLICGTSTGGIIAIGLALGMSADKILNLYTGKAQKIFGSHITSPLKAIRRLAYPKHSNQGLEEVLKEAFSPFSVANSETRIGHAKTRLVIPAYVASLGKPRIFKTSHHNGLTRDYQVPAYQVALATSSAPTFFPAHSFEYVNTRTHQSDTLTNLIDGGIFANNPALIGFSEAVALGISLPDLMILSIGTGTGVLKEPFQKNNYLPRWGGMYWMNPLKGPPIIEMMMQANSEITDNTLKVLSKGIGQDSQHVFQYDRVQIKFDSQKENLNLDTTRKKNLEFLNLKGKELFDIYGQKTILDYFDHKIDHYTPSYSL